MTLLQDLPDLLVETHWYSVDGSVQPASPQPLALSFFPVQLAVSWTVAHRGQDPAGSGGAAATLLWQQKNTVRKYLVNIQCYQCRSNFNLISMHLNVFHAHKVTVICSDREVTSKMYYIISLYYTIRAVNDTLPCSRNLSYWFGSEAKGP